MTVEPERPACDDPAHCITCSDAVETMRVIDIRSDGTTAVCVDETGRHSEVLLGLVPDVRLGVVVLVHAGVALSVVRPANEALRP